jgi:hypothetical protein
VLSVYLSVVIGLLPLGVAQSPTDFPMLVSRAPVVAVGRITEVGEPPGGWSTGGFHFAQKVKYKIVSVLKGEGLGDEVTVYFFLFEGAANTEPDRPMLSESLFAVGKEHLLFIRPINPDGSAVLPSGIIKEFMAINTAHGAMPATEGNLKEVRKALSAR